MLRFRIKLEWSTTSTANAHSSLDWSSSGSLSDKRFNSIVISGNVSPTLTHRNSAVLANVAAKHLRQKLRWIPHWICLIILSVLAVFLERSIVVYASAYNDRWSINWMAISTITAEAPTKLFSSKTAQLGSFDWSQRIHKRQLKDHQVRRWYRAWSVGIGCFDQMARLTLSWELSAHVHVSLWVSLSVSCWIVMCLYRVDVCLSLFVVCVFCV